MLELNTLKLVISEKNYDINLGEWTEVEYTQKVRCKQGKTFSVSYYSQLNRTDKNNAIFEVQKHVLKNKVIKYVIFNEKKYAVKRILEKKNSSMKMLLDCEEALR